MNLGHHFDFSKTESQSFVIHSVRLGFLLVVLAFVLAFQLIETRVDAEQVFQPLYGLIGFSLFLQIGFLLFFKRLYHRSVVTGFLFFFEAIYVTGLIYFIGIQQSILIFLYLVNLILCGILFQRKGALLLALWTSVLFSFIVSLDTSLGGNTAYLAVGVNNLAFFTVAYLAGYLSEQLNVMGEQLAESVRDVRTLKNLNELILNSIGSGLLTIDRNHRILQANPGVFSQLGVAPRDLNGSEVYDILPGIEITTRPVDKEFDYIFPRQQEKRILSVNIAVLKDEQGREQGRIVSFQDKTHLRALEKRVRQSEKMAAIGQLAAGIAHEIRNPLAGISGSIQLLQASDSDPAHTEKLMGIIIKEIDRLNNLITEFLDFAKPEAPKEDRVKLGKLLKEIVDFTSVEYPKIRDHIQFQCPEEVELLANRDKLRQAFINIVVNAFQAMEKQESPALEVLVRESGGRAIVSIKDNGSGMSAETVDRIFEPFHTTKHKGTGLGLAITHTIFESHGADVQVESEKGVGTEFIIRFNEASELR